MEGMCNLADTGDTKSKPTLGFLTVLEHAQHGLFGGYLVLNTAGRPLEFHCTAPIKPNRAQQILYGPTLESFLFGEQIGQTLLAKSRNEPLLVCTDREPVLAVREHVALPVALVLPGEQDLPGDVDGPVFDPGGAGREPSPTLPHRSLALNLESCVPNSQATASRYRIDTAHVGGSRLITFQLGRNRLAVPAQGDDDRRLITQRLGELAETFDLAEPFARIREAIEEAQQAVR